MFSHIFLILLCSTYLDHLAEEVSDKLQEAGLISIAELCKIYDLPGDFLNEVSDTPASLNLYGNHKRNLHRSWERTCVICN